MCYKAFVSSYQPVNDALVERFKTHLCIECFTRAQNVKKGFTPGEEVSDAIGEEKGREEKGQKKGEEKEKIKENIEKEVALVDLISPNQTKEKDPKASSLVINSDGELQLHLSFLH
jgi:hypothetical protein